MILPKSFTTVTPLSKTVALIMFTVLPIAAFLLGMKYQTMLNDNQNQPPPGSVSCTLEAKICPDGSSVGRSGPNCEFAACPTVQMTPTTEPPSNNLMYTPKNK